MSFAVPGMTVIVIYDASLASERSVTEDCRK
jgi:hypothetical protein